MNLKALENPINIKPDPRRKTKPIRFDKKTVIYVDPALTKEQIERHIENYKKRQLSFDKSVLG